MAQLKKTFAKRFGQRLTLILTIGKKKSDAYCRVPRIVHQT
jgi:hypothetical protein